MKDKKIVIPIAALAIFFIFYMNYSDLKEKYLLFFKKSGVITHFDKRGQLSGKNTIITDGEIETQTNYLDGKKEGWMINYYKNGQIKHKTFFRSDKANGPEYVYNENGKLRYSVNNENDRRLGALNWYDESGNLNTYAVFNIRGESFCSFSFNRSKKITDMKGFVISPDIYSIDTKDSVVLLNFNLDQEKGYKDINDLYIVVATPPDLHLQLIVNVNNQKFENLPINNNLVKVRNVFSKPGLYKILIESHLFDKNNSIVNGINVERTVKIE